MEKPKKTPKQTKINKERKPIIEVDCLVEASNKAVFIKYENVTYIANKEHVSSLLDGTLTTKDGNESHSVPFGIKTKNGIDNENNVFLTLKGKALYFVPKEDEVLVTNIDSMKNLITGDWHYLRLGKFQD